MLFFNSDYIIQTFIKKNASQQKMDAKERAKELLEEKLEETVIETSTLLDNTIKNFRQGNNYNLIKKELSKIGNCIKYVASIYLELFGLEKSELRNGT